MSDIPDPTDTFIPEMMTLRSFKETKRVTDFSCGNKDLDDFLNTKEVENYDTENLGKTQMVYYRGQLVAYFTISFAGLKRELVKGLKKFSLPKVIDIESYPAIKIGRLAVQKEWQRKGIGKSLLKYIVAYGLETRVKGGLRLIIVEAEPESQKFYEKFGFILVNQTRHERKRTHKTMFFDLSELDGSIAEE